MNPVTNLPELRPRVVVDPDKIDQLRWFQMNRYFESGLLDELPTELPADPTVTESIYFGLYRDAEIQATVRIVYPAAGLPMLEHHTFYPHFQELIDEGHEVVGEVSRLAVGSDTPHYRALALLLGHGLVNQHATLLIASVEKPLVRILNRMMGIPLSIIGPPIEQYGLYPGECVPILIDAAACLEHFRNEGSGRWQFFAKDLVIDLTEKFDRSRTSH